MSRQLLKCVTQYDINLFARDKERNVSIWDARELKTEEKAAENFSSKTTTQFPLLHFLRLQQEASHGTNIDCRHLVMASPYGVVLMDFWDAADPQNKNGTMKSERGETNAEENKNLGVTAKSGSIGALIQQMADFKQTLEFGGNRNQNKQNCVTTYLYQISSLKEDQMIDYLSTKLHFLFYEFLTFY